MKYWSCYYTEPWKYYAKWRKLITKAHKLYNFTHNMKCSEYANPQRQRGEVIAWRWRATANGFWGSSGGGKCSNIDCGDGGTTVWIY